MNEDFEVEIPSEAIDDIAKLVAVFYAGLTVRGVPEAAALELTKHEMVLLTAAIQEAG